MKKLCLALLLVLGLLARPVLAASVSASLSADETSVGTPIGLQIEVQGTTNAIVPDIEVDGLRIISSGRQTKVSVINGRMTASSVFLYTVVPTREGTFEIPSLEINADGRVEKTAAQKLVVQPGVAPPPRGVSPSMRPPSGMPGQSQAPATSSSSSDERPAFTEIIVPKKTAYAGEVIPVEVRFYLRGDARFRAAQDEPQVRGEGFTVQKLEPAVRTQEDRGGTTYLVLSYKTAIMAVKSGELTLPTVSFQGILSLPSNGSSNMSSPFDQLFAGMGMSDDREENVTSDPKTIRIKPLPVEGRPANFSGAVGDFNIAATADPTTVEPGDPVNLKVAVTGRGNFEAMGDPQLIDTDGWKSYPPTSRFEKADGVGYGGTKTFETPLVALEPQTKTPVAELSFFNPEQEKYSTIRTLPIAVTAKASATPTPAEAAAANPSPSATPGSDKGGVWLTKTTSRSWHPLITSPAFWMVNGIAALILIGLIVAAMIRKSRQGPAARRAALLRDRNRLIGALGGSSLSDEAFYGKVLEVLTIQAHLENLPGPFEFIRSLETNGRNVSELQTVLANADEFKFSGGSGATARLGAEDRQRIIRAISEVCR